MNVRFSTRVRPEIFGRHWHDAVVEEVAAEYEAKGYRVERDVRIGALRADVVASLDGQRVVIEVKTLRWASDEARRADRLRQAATSLGAQFRLVLAFPPREVDFEIEGLDAVIAELLADRLEDTEVAQIAKVVRVESVVAIDVDWVRVRRDGTEVRGEGEAEFELVYGSGGGDDGMTTSDIFPFGFHVRLDHDLSVVDVLELDVDVSSFYGDQ